MVPALAIFVRCSLGFMTSYWQKERWSRRAADTLTNYGRCWNPSLGNWDVNLKAVPSRSCQVSFTDAEGIEHSIRVPAESLYEAAVEAIAAFRRSVLAEMPVGPG